MLYCQLFVDRCFLASILLVFPFLHTLFQVLEALIAKYNEQDEIKEYIAIKGVKIHFVEDRYETLLAVMKIPELDDVQLYLVDWGYNTEIQRNQAKELSPRIKLINGEEFQDLASQFII